MSLEPQGNCAHAVRHRRCIAGELALRAVPDCQPSSAADLGERVDAVAAARPASRRAAGCPSDGRSVDCSRSTNSANRPASSTPGAADVVERQRGAEPGLGVVGHRDAGAGPGRARSARCSGWHAVRGGTAPRSAALQPPPDPGPAGPSRRRAPAPRRRNRPRGPPAARARSSTWRPVTRPWASSSSRGDRRARVGLLRARSASRTRSACPGAAGRLAEPEGRRDQRGERLDVRAHHHHVARLERRIVLDMPSSTSRSTSTCRAGRGRRAPAATGRRPRAVSCRLSGAPGPGEEVLLQPAESNDVPPAGRAGPPAGRPGPPARRVPPAGRACRDHSPTGRYSSTSGTPPAAASRTCISRASRPHDPINGCRGSAGAGSSAGAVPRPPETLCATRSHSA